MLLEPLQGTGRKLILSLLITINPVKNREGKLRNVTSSFLQGRERNLPYV
jgi:hypothetical protein